MSIEQNAETDLSLSDSDAEQVTGGVKSKKAAKKTAAPKKYPVTYINVPVTPSNTPVDDSGTTAWGDDCDDPSV